MRNEIIERLGKIAKSEKHIKFCKKLSSFSHATVSLKEYQRMKDFSDDTQLIENTYDILSEYPLPENDIMSEFQFDIIGYSYCIALLSQSEYNRTENLLLLSKIADEAIQKQCTYGKVLLRNMKKLKKDYPDLTELEEKLKFFA